MLDPDPDEMNADPQPCLWHPSNSRKKSNSRDVSKSRDPSSNRNASFKQGTSAEEGTKCQQQQDLCGKATKVARNEARNMAVNVALIWWSWKVHKWPWLSLGVAVKACRDLATLEISLKQQAHYSPTMLLHEGFISITYLACSPCRKTGELINSES